MEKVKLSSISDPKSLWMTDKKSNVLLQLNKDKPETENKCSYKDLTKMTEDELLEGLFTDKENFII